jgi:alkylation response protein AidB-like acyl-CoA dehydrogenase
MTGQLDRRELREQVADILARENAISTVKSAAGRGEDSHAALWPLFAGLGWLGLTAPERFDGLGQGFSHLAVLYREMGAVLAPGSFLSTIAFVDALSLAGTEAQQREFLPGIAAGDFSVLLQTPEAAPTISARVKGKKIHLDGEARFFFGSIGARYALLPVTFDAGASGYVIVDTDGVAIRQEACWDPTRSLFALRCTDREIPTERLLCEGAVVTALRSRLLSHVGLGLACDSVGGASAILAATLEYMGLRRQFGRPIASFQALKHRCADHKADLDGAAAFLDGICDAVALGNEALPAQISAVKQHACAVYKGIAEDAIQLHGGIGFTWEHPCHLFLKRARLNEMLCGTANWHRDAIAAALIKGDARS